MILIRPIISEKTLRLASAKKYTFQVALSSTKTQIKKAVEKTFPVKVLAVRTGILPGSRYRLGKRQIYRRRSDWKKAVITVKPDQTIPLFETAANTK